MDSSTRGAWMERPPALPNTAFGMNDPCSQFGFKPLLLCRSQRPTSVHVAPWCWRDAPSTRFLGLRLREIGVRTNARDATRIPHGRSPLLTVEYSLRPTLTLLRTMTMPLSTTSPKGLKSMDIWYHIAAFLDPPGLLALRTVSTSAGLYQFSET